MTCENLKILLFRELFIFIIIIVTYKLQRLGMIFIEVLYKYG